MSKQETPKPPRGKQIERGSVIKGGQNTGVSQIPTRPAPPKPTKPKK